MNRLCKPEKTGTTVGETALNLALTVRFPVTFDSVQLNPLQSPEKPANVYPGLAVAVQMTLWPRRTGFGAQTNVPPPTGVTRPVT